MLAIIVKIVIIFMFVIKLINFLLSFKLKRKIENYDMLVAMRVYDGYENEIAKDLYKFATPLIIFAIIELITILFSLIGMFVTGHWLLGVIFILSCIKFKYEKQYTATNALPLKVKKRKIISIIAEIFQLALIVLFFFLL